MRVEGIPMLATIGYERAELNDFVATLVHSDIEILVDIRDRAQSRRPGFSKSVLSSSITEAGIEYVHLKALGDPKDGREAARAGDFHRFRRIFSGVMESEGGKEAMFALEQLASSANVCLMCFERDYLTCHRKIVSDHLETVLRKKAQHLGVRHGIGRTSSPRRVHNLDQGAPASLEPVF